MRIQELRVRLREAYWAVPAGLTAGSLLLSVLLVRVDSRLHREGFALAFTGGPESARSVLSAIASSMLTLTALVFSVTVIVLQLASTQFSPRVLRTFLDARQNQVTLGVFTGTFVYALAALRTVRGEDGIVDQFVPGVTISAAFALVLVSVGLFVAYIEHITRSIRVATIIDRIAEDTDREIRSRPSPLPEPVRETLPLRYAGVSREVLAPRRGVIRAVDHDAVVRALAEDGDGWCEVTVRVGDFVPEGGVLALIHGFGGSPGQIADRFLFGSERTIRGDVTFGFRQLVDIAARALSTGVNDPTTAVQCLDQIHHLLRRLVVLPTPAGVVAGDDGVVRLVHPVVTWPAVLGLALDEIWEAGATSSQVRTRLEALVRDLLTCAPAERRTSLQKQLAHLVPPGSR
jgi:uncharacterized membrane protein